MMKTNVEESLEKRPQKNGGYKNDMRICWCNEDVKRYSRADPGT